MVGQRRLASGELPASRAGSTPEPGSEGLHGVAPLPIPFDADGKGRGDSHRRRDVLPTRPPPSLLRPAVLERVESDTRADEEEPAPAGAQLGPRVGGEVDAAEGDVQPLRALAGVQVAPPFGSVAPGPDGGHPVARE